MTPTGTIPVDTPATPAKAALAATGLSLALAILLLFAGFIFHALALASASVAFGIGAVTVSGAWSLVRRGAREFPRGPGWLIAPVAGWALSAPLSAVVWAALPPAADSSTGVPAFELVPQIWLWALVPTAIYAAVAVRRRDRH
jgi:hypothetical protein